MPSGNNKKFMINIPIKEKIGVEQRGMIKVGSQILNQLSKGVYSTPAMALKELISNAYDADASKVTIETKSAGSVLVIRDNGHGMNHTDFDQKFAYISKSPKVSESDRSKKYGRPIIGRLGIGFIAVSTLCDTMIISSTTKESDTKFIAVLDFSKFKRKDARDRDFHELSEYRITIQTKNEDEEPYTHIELRNLEAPFRNILINKTGDNTKLRNSRGMSFDEIVKKMWKSSKLFKIGKEYGPYWEFVMNLASIIPVEYLPDGPVCDKKFMATVRPLKKRAKDLNFTVSFDGMQLKKPYLFPTHNALESGNYTIIPISATIPNPRGGHIKYDGYVYSQDGGINVDDFRGLVVRVKNTGVGTRSQNFLDYPGLSDSLYFKWTFGEIYVTEGLNESMNIDRATFKASDSEYGAFADSLHDKMQQEVFESVQKRWRARVKQERLNVEEYKKDWRDRCLTEAFGRKFEMIRRTNQELPVTLYVRDGRVELDMKHRLFEGLPRKERAILQDVLLAIAIAREKYPRSTHKQEEHMYELLGDLIGGYPKTGLKYKRSGTEIQTSN